MNYKNQFFILLLLFFCHSSFGQSPSFEFEPSIEHPFGLPNPSAPSQLLDWAPLIGESDCVSTRRKADQTWENPVDMVWRFKYIMNGTAVQDETLKEDDFYAGSIRQFIADSNHWYVHYYSSVSPSTILPAWEGNKMDNGEIILYRQQKAPNGMEGFYKIRFFDISPTEFKWLGAWVSTDESVSFPTWKIDCKKKTAGTSETEKAVLMKKIKAFSQAYMDGDYDAIASAYTDDGKIFPNNTKIIEGHEAIKKQWQLPASSKIESHRIFPEEIQFIGDYAYDYGYYEGRTRNGDNEVSDWKGKYVIIWKKVEGDWKMYLDIWNRVRE